MDVQSGDDTESHGLRQQPNLNTTVCLLCRQRKMKCDRKLPRCGNCTKGKLDCFYVTIQRKPGLRAGYVAELEHRIECLEKDMSEMKVQSFGQPKLATSTGFPVFQQSNLGPPAPFSITQGPVRRLSPLLDPSRVSAQSLTSPELLPKIVNLWFKLYHPWFPILHQPSFVVNLRNQGASFSSDFGIILKAIASVVSYGYHDLLPGSAGLVGRTAESLQLHDEIIIHALGHLSLQSLQALLILSVADISLGNLSAFWKIVALCRNIGTQLGLKDLVAHYCLNYNQSSVFAPRMLPPPSTMIEREERIRAYWMIECLDASSTVGSAWNIGLLASFPTELLPCGDDIWEENDPSEWNPDREEVASKSISFSLYVALITKELNRVHNAMQEPYDFSLHVEHERWVSNCNDVYDELCSWRSTSLPNPFSTYGFDTDGKLKLDVNAISANIALDSAIIAMYQKRALGNQHVDMILGRCIYACNNVAAITGIIIEKVELIGPHNIFGLFVAARFLLVHSRTFARPIQENTHSLIRLFREAAKHWHLAAILERVLTTAEQEHGKAFPEISITPQFYDLKYSALDIYEALRVWSVGLPLSNSLPPIES